MSRIFTGVVGTALTSSRSVPEFNYRV